MPDTRRAHRSGHKEALSQTLTFHRMRTPAEFAEILSPRRALTPRQLSGSAPTPDITVRKDKTNSGNEL